MALKDIVIRIAVFVWEPEIIRAMNGIKFKEFKKIWVTCQSKDMSGYFYLLVTVTSWTFLLLVGALTWFVLNGMQGMKRLSLKWKRSFIGAQVFATILNVTGAAYSTMILSGYGKFDKDVKQHEWQIILCTVADSIGAAAVCLCYAYYGWFWFIRLEIIFEKAADSLKVSQFEHKCVYYWFIASHFEALLYMTLIHIRPIAVERVGGDEFVCMPNVTSDLLISLIALFSIFLYLCLSMYLCYAYIRRLKLVMLNRLKERGVGGTVNRLSEKEKLLIRKTVIIAVTSVICSSILLFILIGYNNLVLPLFDLILNTLFIACYFQFGKPLYERIFCVCEKNSHWVNKLCGLGDSRDMPEKSMSLEPAASATAASSERSS